MLSNLKGLNAFRAVMEAGTLTDAAKRLGVTQPAVSRLIANLEDEAGLTLFRRQRQRLVPTVEAEVFYREAVRVLSAWEQIPQLAGNIQARQGHRLRIVSMPRLATGVLPDILLAYSKRYPETQLTVDVLSRHELEKWSQSQPFDIGLMAFPINHPALQCVPMFSVRAVIAMSRDHPLAGRKSIEVGELINEPFVVPAQGLIVRDQLERLFMQVGCKPIVRMESSSSIFATRLAAHGFGLCMIDPITAMWVGGKDMAMVELAPPYEILFGVVYHLARPPTLVANRFIEITKEVVPTLLDKTGIPYRMLDGSNPNVVAAE
ncbi:MAG: LysR family transcriptional regulator [Proteobacteria bacterium]|nr:LysR family transcriptional regulator [Pseudomonadota bacterium]